MSADTHKTWLEVALNGPWTQQRQPGIPIAVSDIVEQGIACVKAGAAIVHVHAYDEVSGRQKDDAEIYARIIGGIRSKVDAIIYTTIPSVGLTGAPEAADPKKRYAHVEELARRGLLEWAAIDPGSTNFAHYDELREDKAGFVYLNAEDDIRHGLNIAMRFQLHPSYAVYEPGYVRLGATLHWRESCPAPVYRFMFSSGYTFGFPPEDYALTAYLKLLDQVAPGAQWMVAGLDVDIQPMIARTVMEGGHLRVGLEDATFGCAKSNMQLVEAAADAITSAGGTLARATDVRVAIAPEEHEPV